MKKNLILLLAASAAIIFTFQNSLAQVALGPKIGLNFSTLRQKDANRDNVVTNAGHVFGVSAVIGGKAAFQPELLISKQGTAFETTFFGITTRSKFNMTYIQVPLLFRYNFLNDNFKVYANIGPSLGFWLAGKTVAKNDDGDKNTTKYDFDSDTDNRLDVPIIAGVGASTKLGPGHVFVDVRYMQGLLGIAKKPDGASNWKPTRHSVVMLGLGYLIVFGGE